MSVSLLVCYFFTEIRQIWGYFHFWMRYLSEIFLKHSWDIGSLVFTLLGWAYILTFEFLCAGPNFETSDLVTFWFSGGQLLRPSGLVCMCVCLCPLYKILIVKHILNISSKKKDISCLTKSTWNIKALKMSIWKISYADDILIIMFECSCLQIKILYFIL